jgi:hypothetical protein
MNKNHSYINKNPNSKVKLKTQIKDIHKIGKLYENMTYFSQYGFSVFLFIFITLIVFSICCFCYSMVKAESIRADWKNQRCHPFIIPFAGFINKPDNMTAVEFTKQNFDYCNQMILKSEAGELLEPLTYITNTLANATNDTKDSIQNVRAMFNKTRGNVQTFSTDMIGSVINDITPLYT